jgi:hypothetical protein
MADQEEEAGGCLFRVLPEGWRVAISVNHAEIPEGTSGLYGNDTEAKVTEEAKLEAELKREKFNVDQWQAEVRSLGERLMEAQKAMIEKRRQDRKDGKDV